MNHRRGLSHKLFRFFSFHYHRVIAKLRRYSVRTFNSRNAHRRFFGWGMMLACVIYLFFDRPIYTTWFIFGWTVLWMVGAYLSGLITDTNME